MITGEDFRKTREIGKKGKERLTEKRERKRESKRKRRVLEVRMQNG